MRARIIKSTGVWYNLITDDHQEIKARLKGLMRLDGLTSTNPVAVGDYVLLEKEQDDWMIINVEKRENYIIRKSPAKKTFSHILAANIDQAFVLVTTSKPRTSTGFIDRFLLTAEAYNIPSILVFNKQDTLTGKDILIQNDLINIYNKIGYECKLVSSITGKGIDDIKIIMKEKTTLLIGHSGVGKSTFANAIDNDLELRTGEMSVKHSKGKHTTTFAEMFSLKFGGNIIDIPGIKEFGVVGFEKEDVGYFFKEFALEAPFCKFNNCIHINEPACAVLQALVDNKISEERYKNYLNILNDIEEEKEY